MLRLMLCHIDSIGFCSYFMWILGQKCCFAVPIHCQMSVNIFQCWSKFFPVITALFTAEFIVFASIRSPLEYTVVKYSQSCTDAQFSN